MKLRTTLLALMALPTLAAAEPAAYLPASDMTWQELGPGIEMTPLWQNADKSDMALLLRLAPGYVGIVHAHHAGYNGVTIQGTWAHIEADGSEHVLPVGSLAYQEPIAPHSDNCISQDPCIILIHLEGEYDFFIPE